jgi:thiamine-phosphate pyrophosphorylase
MFPALYAIVDTEWAGEGILGIADALANAGVTLIQYRGKQATSREAYATCRKLVERLRGRARFIVNDRADIAALCDAGGVHVGQDDLGVEDARLICGADRWVGVSTHNLAQFGAAAETSADYIAVGPIFATVSKTNPDPVTGLDFIRKARGLTAKPIVAIGGIRIENAESVYRAGADSIAVIRDLTAADDPAARAVEYLKIAKRAQSQGQAGASGMRSR